MKERRESTLCENKKHPLGRASRFVKKGAPGPESRRRLGGRRDSLGLVVELAALGRVGFLRLLVALGARGNRAAVLVEAYGILSPLKVHHEKRDPLL